MPRLSLFLLLVALAAPSVLAQTWQQRVAYTMDVRLDTERHRLNGRQRLVYTNASPDTLDRVFYHLYFNAFHPGSMMAERNRVLPDPDPRIVPRIFELGPDERGWVEVASLTQDGEPVGFEVHDTVMRVDARPIPPGVSAVFEMAFATQVPLQTRRSGRDNDEGIDYTMTQWYPKMAAYDERGWHADPYVGREFYAPFGSFDVRLTLPAAYVVGATGVLQNPQSVGHGYDQPQGSGLTTSGPAPRADGSPPDSLTWHFRAEDVHDFAWAADPDYLHVQTLARDVPGRAEPVALHLLFQPDVAEVWSPFGPQLAELVRFFSARYGAYAYPQFTVVQAGDGGMEYPMLTTITGRRSPGSLLGVTSHELAHMWFYGMVGSNEAGAAWMDEGLSSFADSEALRHVLRADATLGATRVRHDAARERIAALQRLGLYERPGKPADWFETNTAYTAASYFAGETLADLLGYVVGDEVRDEVLRTYVERYTFRHPGPDDLLTTAQDVSGLQLGWLFEQFLEGGESYDYGAERLRHDEVPGGTRSTVTLRRHEAGLLPVDVLLKYQGGTEELVTIPLTLMEGHKPVPEAWTVAEPWAWTSPTYDLVVERPRRVIEAVVDPDARMLDLDASNNRVRAGKPDVPQQFDGFFRTPRPARDRITYTLSGIGLYSDLYGAGFGAQLRAAFPYGRASLQLGVVAWPDALADEARGLPPAPPLIPPQHEPAPFPSRFGELQSAPLDGLDYTAVYVRRGVLGPLGALQIQAHKHLGIVEHRLGLTAVFGRFPTLRRWSHTLTAEVGHQQRVSDRAFETSFPQFDLIPFAPFGLESFTDAPVLSARLDWRLGDALSEITASAELGGTLRDREPFALRSFLPEAGEAHRVWVTATRSGPVGPVAGVARFAAGLGSDGLVPQKRFGLGLASAETRWRSHAYRALAAAPEAPQEDLHLFAFSGVGPVAYALGERLRPSFFETIVPRAYPVTGTRFVAGTLALRTGFPRFAGLDGAQAEALAPFEFEVFSGFGALGQPDADDVLGAFVADAGLGLRYDLGALRLAAERIDQSDVLRGLRFAAKFPLWVSDPDLLAPGEDAFGFRWLIGVETGL